MTVIHKYPFDLLSSVTVELPQGAQALHVGYQRTTDQWCLWAAVDPLQPLVSVQLYVVGTGHALPEAPCQYLNTVLAQQGACVFHFYIGATTVHTYECIYRGTRMTIGAATLVEAQTRAAKIFKAQKMDDVTVVRL